MIRIPRIPETYWNSAGSLKNALLELRKTGKTGKFLNNLPAGDESLLREGQVTQPEAFYNLIERQSDMGDPNSAYRIEVAQIGNDGRSGVPGKIEVPA